jgi:hypothetical protein
MTDNVAQNNGGCLHVADDSSVTLRSSNFRDNRAQKLGNDIFIQDDDKDTYVKCNDQVVFCDGVAAGINDSSSFDNTNCDKIAREDGDFCV